MGRFLRVQKSFCFTRVRKSFCAQELLCLRAFVPKSFCAQELLCPRAFVPKGTFYPVYLRFCLTLQFIECYVAFYLRFCSTFIIYAVLWSVLFALLFGFLTQFCMQDLVRVSIRFFYAGLGWHQYSLFGGVFYFSKIHICTNVQLYMWRKLVSVYI